MYTHSKRSSYPTYGSEDQPESMRIHQDMGSPGISRRNGQDSNRRASYHPKSTPTLASSPKQSKLPANRASFPAYRTQDQPKYSQSRQDMNFTSPPLRNKEEHNSRTSYQPNSSLKPMQSAQAAKILSNRASYPTYDSQDQSGSPWLQRENDARSTLHHNRDEYSPRTSYNLMSPPEPTQSAHAHKSPGNRASYPTYGSQDQFDSSRVRRELDYPDEYNRRASYHPMSLPSPTQAFQDSQLPPGTIPYNAPIIIYAHGGPPEEKESPSFTQRLKKAFAAVTENPDEAMLGCKPGKTNEEFKSKRAERLKEMAEEELKYKNRRSIIKKWTDRRPDEDEPSQRVREHRVPAQAGPVPRDSNYAARKYRGEEEIRRSRDDAYSRK